MDYTLHYQKMQQTLPPKEVQDSFVLLLKEHAPVGAHLHAVDLSGCDLTGISFFKCEIIDCNFTDAVLRNVEFSGAQISHSNFSNANLESAGFGSSIVQNTLFFNANLKHATLSIARFEKCDFRCATLIDARITEAVMHSCDLTQATMERCNLLQSSVAHSVFNEVSLEGSKIRDISDYEGAKWIGTDIRNINFAGAYHLRRHIQDENYIYEFQQRSALHSIYYKIWMITSDCGRSLTRWIILILLQISIFTYIYTVVDIDYGKYESTISPLYYSIATMTTLGYGDVIPASGVAQMTASLQVVLGYIMLGGLLSILTNKLARRAD